MNLMKPLKGLALKKKKVPDPQEPEELDGIVVKIADDSCLSYVDTILKTIEEAAKIRGTGIARRSPEYIELKISERKAIIALSGDEFAGFCYIETWGNKQFVAN